MIAAVLTPPPIFSSHARLRLRPRLQFLTSHPSAPIPPSAESAESANSASSATSANSGCTQCENQQLHPGSYHTFITYAPPPSPGRPPFTFSPRTESDNTLNVDFLALRSRPAELETDGASETSEESNGIRSYVPAPPPSLAELTHVTRTDTPTWRDSTNAHFRMRALAAHATDRLRALEHEDGEESEDTPRASVQPPENPFLAPLRPPSPESARRGEYFYGYCLNDDPFSHDRANIASPGLIDSGSQVSFTFVPRGPPSTGDIQFIELRRVLSLLLRRRFPVR
ncbi:hypothetical protein C8J57DRAFT_1577275 [Mycena rebaudengoi]|nr:hypothetical protein C8J57DRAFT_1577275 [Mycena rebaudengoi]